MLCPDRWQENREKQFCSKSARSVRSRMARYLITFAPQQVVHEACRFCHPPLFSSQTDFLHEAWKATQTGLRITLPPARDSPTPHVLHHTTATCWAALPSCCCQTRLDSLSPGNVLHPRRNSSAALAQASRLRRSSETQEMGTPITYHDSDMAEHGETA